MKSLYICFIILISEAFLTRQEIRKFFASPEQPLHRRFEALRAFFLDRRSASEVAERFGYSRSAVYNMTRDFARLDDPAAAFFRDPVPRGRPAVPINERLRQHIVALRQRNLSVPDIKVWLDAEGKSPSPSEGRIATVLREEGFPRLPRRTRSERFAVAPPPETAPVSIPLALDGSESFQCESAGGVLCLLPWVRRYGIDRAIEQAGFPGSAAVPALQSVLAVLALKLAGVGRYRGDNQWCMDRGLGLFAGLNVLPKAAWFSSYSHRVSQSMNQRLLAAMARALSQRGLASETANLEFTSVPHWGEDATQHEQRSGQRDRRLVNLSLALARDPESGLLLRYDTASGAVLEFLDFFRRHGPKVRYLAFDGRFTTYANLARLNEDGVLFVTARRRGQRMVASADHIRAADRREVRIPLARGTRLVQAHDGRVKLRGYGGKLREITVFRGSRRRPAILLTNDFDSTLSHILRRYAGRWIVDQSIAEQLVFFHLNRRSSSMVIKIDFDLAITSVAYNLYRLLALDLPTGHRHLPARTIFDKMLSAGASVHLAPDCCTVALKKNRYLPDLLHTIHTQDPVRIPWLGNRRIEFQAATGS